MKRMLNEDITSGSVIVYHRTGKKGQNPVKSIAADGYRVGEGDAYGIGVYTTYNLESQLNDKMIKTYGSIIIESKVLSMKDFLIFDYDIAKRIYGNKNYTLDKQLEIFLGNDWNKYKNNNQLRSLISDLNSKEFSSEIAEIFYNNYPDIITKLRGIVFTGKTDGNVLISYDRKNVEPIRYTEDEGKTWKNIINKDLYQRLKGYTDQNTDLTFIHIMNKLDVRTVLNIKEMDYLINNIDRFIPKLNAKIIATQLKYSSGKGDILTDILLDKKDFISNSDNELINKLIYYSSVPDTVVNRLLQNNKFVSKLDTAEINYILEYVSNPEQMKQIIKNLRPDLKLESKINIKKIIQEEINKIKNLSI
jgi:hypothetical protein